MREKYVLLGFAMMLTLDAAAAPIIVDGSAPDAAGIAPLVDAFRGVLGDPLNGNTPGPLANGRREINWDGGGGNSTTAVAGNPFDGFLNSRGARFTTPGSGFVQGTPEGLAAQFGQAGYASEFAAFSPLRLFSAIGGNITDVTFFIPGTNGAVAAGVHAFGAVLSDVDRIGATNLEFFDLNDVSLGLFEVLANDAPSGSFSFFGASFADELIGRVRITLGNAAPGAVDGGDVDVVMMDDFLFSEPQRVPAPSELGVMMGLGLFANWLLRRRVLSASAAR